MLFWSFVGWFCTLGALIGFLVALIGFGILGSHEESVKKTKKEKFESEYDWAWDARKAFDAWEKEYDKSREKYWKMIVVLVLIVMIAVASFGTYGDYMYEKTLWTEENYVTHKIVNIADNSEIGGSISGTRRYVRGYISENTVYHYYYKNSRGGWDLQKVSEENACLFPTDGEPVAKWYRIHKKFWWNEETKYRCDIYIPDGTITTEFVIDME